MDAGCGVAPFMGAWIETRGLCRKARHQKHVAPFMGAWIETLLSHLYACIPLESRPSWARGLKQPESRGRAGGRRVAPFMGAWIETIPRRLIHPARPPVAPFMGAWIETRSVIGC